MTTVHAFQEELMNNGGLSIFVSVLVVLLLVLILLALVDVL